LTVFGLTYVFFNLFDHDAFILIYASCFTRTGRP